jgi:hypothetical protein
VVQLLSSHVFDIVCIIIIIIISIITIIIIVVRKSHYMLTLTALTTQSTAPLITSVCFTITSSHDISY